MKRVLRYNWGLAWLALGASFVLSDEAKNFLRNPGFEQRDAGQVATWQVAGSWQGSLETHPDKRSLFDPNDGVHLTNAGNRFIALRLLEYLGRQ